jgi:hypothetical protein
MIKIAATILAISALCSSPALADNSDSAFFKKVTGKWAGPGEIVAGKYKGTKFTCNFDGSTATASNGMTMDGTCRVGVFTQAMKATVAMSGGSYKGSFLDGSSGKGLDITAGNVAGNRATFSLNRKQLNGAMLARLTSGSDMNVTISVRVNKEMVPVIGMSLKRMDNAATGSIAEK